jgi:uncharacterized protein (TIGR01777 family)
MPRVLISGASGLIGSALVPSLESHGYEVIRLVRRGTRQANELQSTMREWDPMHSIPPETVSGYDAIIHLSGENVAGHWTASKKARVRDSRVVSTTNLSEALAKSHNPPKTFLCASATGYYGSRGDEILSEESSPGTGFLAEVCREWESATEPAARAGIRTVNLRTGLVLSKKGGPLREMLLPFLLGLGGRIGNGRQWWSWIHIEDFAAAVQHILQHESFSGSANMVSPDAVTNAEFTNTLAKALHRPALFAVPAFAAKLAFGELADEALLASARVLPSKLTQSGFTVRFPQLKAALIDLLG